MIDDRLYNFELNPDNGILIPPYEPKKSKASLIDDSDPTLKNLQKWFERSEVIEAEDIRTLDKSSIFSD